MKWQDDHEWSIGKVWVKTVVAHFKLLFENSLEDTEKNHEKYQSGRQ
jgi:hypothetical protein